MTTAVESAAWSKSQVSALKECKRKYFFQRTTGTAGEDPASNPILKLKSLKNRFLWSGSVVHEIIGDLLKTLRQGEVLPAVDAVIQKTKERMRDEFKDSLKGSDSPSRLFEHEYKKLVAQHIWLQQWNGVEQSIKGFMSSSWLDRLSKIGPESWKAVDEVLKFDVDGVKAYVKIDCGIEVNGEFFLMDWKTSQIKPGDEANLLVAALYAHEVWGADPASITAVSVSLQDGKSFKATVNEESLMETFLKIQEEASILDSESVPEGTDPLSIPKAASLQTCDRCNFQRLCYPGGIGA